MTAKNGLPCVKCGTAEWSRRGDCRECTRENKRRWRKNNPEKAHEQDRRYRQAHPEKRRDGLRRWLGQHPEKNREHVRQWRKDNPQKKYEMERRWRQANPDKAHEYSRRYYQANKEKKRKYGRRWQQENPDKIRAYTHRRRARIEGNGGSYTAAERQALCEYYDNKCLYPGCERTDLTPDHVIPVSKGGSNDISNIQPLCLHHNQSKNDKCIDYRTKHGIERWIQKSLF